MNPFKTLFLSLLIALSTGCPATQKLPAETEAPRSASPVSNVPETMNTAIVDQQLAVNQPVTPPAPQKDNNGNLIPIVAGIAAIAGIGIISAKFFKGKNLDEISKVKFTQNEIRTKIEESMNRLQIMMTKYSDLKSENVSQNTIGEIVKAAKINGKKNAEMYWRGDKLTIKNLFVKGFSEHKAIIDYNKIILNPQATLALRQQAIIESYNLSMLLFIEYAASSLGMAEFSKLEILEVRDNLNKVALYTAQKLEEAMLEKGIIIEIKHSWVTGRNGVLNQLFPT